MLEVRDIFKAYGQVLALSGVHLDVAPGKVHGLIGPNGSGKSTLLQVIAGGIAPDAGIIRLAGREITMWSAAERARAGLSMKFQIPRVFPHLTVHDNILLSLQAGESLWSLTRSRTRAHLADRVAELLERFHLASRPRILGGALSHGEKQWLEIAMAIAPGPRLLLLDEPTSGMSPEERRTTGEVLSRVSQGCAILIVEHDLAFIKARCDVITVLQQGKVLAEGPPSQIEASERVRDLYVART